MRADLYRLGLASALGLALVAFGGFAPLWALTFAGGIVAGLALAVLVPDIEPFFRGAWGRLAGGFYQLQKKPPAFFRSVASVGKTVWPKPPNFASLIRNLGSVFSFCWRWKWAILAVTLFLLLSNTLSSCAHFGKSRGELARERDQARADLGAEREMARAIVPIVGEWRETRARIEAAHEHARETLENAPRENGETDFLLAWARADRGLLDAASRPA